MQLVNAIGKRNWRMPISIMNPWERTGPGEFAGIAGISIIQQCHLPSLFRRLTASLVVLGLSKTIFASWIQAATWSSSLLLFAARLQALFRCSIPIIKRIDGCWIFTPLSEYFHPECAFDSNGFKRERFKMDLNGRLRRSCRAIWATAAK